MRALLLIVALVTLGACGTLSRGGEGAQATDAQPVAETVPPASIAATEVATAAPTAVVRLPLYAAGSDVPDAATSGIITILGECVWIDVGPHLTLLVWPSDTTFDSNDEAVIVGGTRYRAGDRVHLGGGLIPLDLPMVTVQAPLSCGATEGWIVASIERLDRVAATEVATATSTATVPATDPRPLASQRETGFPLHVPDGFGPAARSLGAISIEGECVRLDTGLAMHLLVWPSGTTFDAGAGAVVTASGDRFRDGDLVRVTGGEVSPALLTIEVLPPPGCIADSLWMVASIEVTPEYLLGAATAPLPSWPWVDAGPSIGIEGTVTIDGGCVRLDVGSRIELLIWPDDAVFDPDAGVVRWRDQRFRNGDRVRVGGGSSEDSSLAPYGEQFPACVAAAIRGIVSIEHSAEPVVLPTHLLASGSPGTEQDDATIAITGEIVVDGSCVLLDSGAALLLLVWPGGRFDQNAGVVVLGGQRFRHGDRLGLGGAELASDDLATLRVPPLPECLTDVAWRITSITPL